MAKQTDRAAMAAALGGMVSRAPEVPAASDPTRRETVAPVTPSGPVAPVAVTAPVAPVTRVRPVAVESGAGDEEGAYRRTGIGYVKADGTEMVRTVVMMTAGERHRLKLLAMEAGVSPSDYVRRAVGFVGEP